MANKRRIQVKPPTEEKEEDNVPDSRCDRDIAIEGTWEEWFQRVFLKYCYGLGVLFLVCMLPLEISRRWEGDLGLAAAFLTVLMIVPLGFFGYSKVWGKGGKWGSGGADDF